jgi:L-fucose isomerase-like protein
MTYPHDQAPKIGIVSNSIGVFSQQGKEVAETQMKALLEDLKREHLVSGDSLSYPRRIFGPTEAEEVADRFAVEKLDALVILDSAFPNGNAFLTLAANRHLSRIPLILTAPPEIQLGNSEWTTNAYCGLIMNNYVAKQLGRHVFPLGGWPAEPAYQAQLKKLLLVIYTIGQLGRDLVGRFGDAPGGFHCATGNALAYARRFGTRIETIDMAAVLATYRTGRASGYKGEVTFSQADVDQTFQKMVEGREVLTQPERVRKGARLFHAFKALIEANGFTSAAFRCWPEIMQIEDISACLSIGWLLSEGVVRAAACEGDWPTAVTQGMASLLSGHPSACLDFVNQIGAAPPAVPAPQVVQLAHCGVGIPCLMAEARIGEISPDRQGGTSMGPTCIGQFCYGVKTGVVLTQDAAGEFKMLAFSGENRPDTNQGLLYAAADVEVPDPARLNQLILEHGFPHHLAVAVGDIREELRLLCDFFGIQYMTPD